ncbi:alpha/beta-hydrolase [Xylariaceae sp. FL1272]|nr:alpha/beta-hydrolase [Xylariaceae sp. FL1272]
MGFFGRKKQPQPPAYPVKDELSPPSHGYDCRDGRGHHNLTPNQHSGYLLPPPQPVPPYGYSYPQSSRPAPPIPNHGQDQRHYAPIIVNQHYYLNPPAQQHSSSNVYPYTGGNATSNRSKVDFAVDLMNLPYNVINAVCDDGLPRWHGYGSQLLNQGAALYDQISSKFDDVMTLIDRDKYAGNETDLFMYNQQPTPVLPDISPSPPVTKGGQGKKNKKDSQKGQPSAVSTSLITSGYFAKVDLYANSRLPLDLPRLRVTMPTYPLLCLAAQYSERVYEKPRGAERDAHVDADWRTGTKAMFIKSVPMDEVNTIVFAIRGTTSFMDWAVNLNTAPTTPTGFLDDPRNFCHAGFLSVAKKMIAPVAARLRQLLEENPERCSYSLLITGHSAGGAVASLLYLHMLSTSKSTTSELNSLTGCFKKVHCITFGSPPVSLFPLQTPSRHELRRSLFYSFINEGDPVVRADKAYVKSLLELFAAPSPSPLKPKESNKQLMPPDIPPSKPSKPQEKKSKASLSSKTSKMSIKSAQSLHSNSSSKTNRSKPKEPAGPQWQVPPSTLSNAGKIIVLRSKNPHSKFKRAKTIEERLSEGVVAEIASDEKLRGVVFGDPVCHVMKFYAARIEALAIEAITAKGR